MISSLWGESLTQQTIFRFISIPNFSSIIVTHHPPSAEHSTFCYHILYLLVIPTSPIRIPYIISIIVTSHNHLTTPPSADPIPVHQQTPFHTLLKFTSRQPRQQVPSVSFTRASISSPDPISQFQQSIFWVKGGI